MSTATPLDTWLAALHGASDRLRHTLEGLPADALSQPSFADGWTVAQVLSHLGSAAEICTTLVERGIAGDDTGPVREELQPVWARWDALPPTAQRDAWREADARHLALLDSLASKNDTSLRIPYFSGPLTAAEYAGYRLSEQSVHAWDVGVALDPAAVIPASEVELLWERLDLIATRFRSGDALSRLAPARLSVELTDPRRSLFLSLDAQLHIYPCEPTDATGTISGPAEAVLRLVYGRNRPPDQVDVSGPITLDDLRELFPGY
jgi:uncharacterized protein (TIGR03083 family)